MTLLLRHERRPRRSIAVPLSCVVCGRGSPTVLRRAEELEADLQAAQQADGQLLHDEPVAVYGCAGCHSLFRDPASVGADVVDRYRRDHYPNGTLEAIHDRARTDLERDASWLLDQGLAE